MNHKNILYKSLNYGDAYDITTAKKMDGSHTSLILFTHIVDFFVSLGRGSFRALHKEQSKRQSKRQSCANCCNAEFYCFQYCY